MIDDLRFYRAPSQRLAFLGQLCAAAAIPVAVYALVLVAFSL